ncbi:MAG: methyltransferase domain-containing protein [Candidatus Thermoplasmatota archaeon]
MDCVLNLSLWAVAEDAVLYAAGAVVPVRLLAEMSGEDLRLAASEISGALEAVGCTAPDIEIDGSAALFHVSEEEGEAAGKRLALVRCLDEVLVIGDKLEDIMSWPDLEQIPKSRMAVRARRLRRDIEVDLREAERSLGSKVAERHIIDIEDPEKELRLLFGRRVYLCLRLMRIDRSGFEARRPMCRPYFSPTTLHPKFARVLVNLSRVPDRGTILDPFCGTGGILMEAALINTSPIGSDISRDAVEGCRANLSHFGIEGVRLEAVDVSEAPGVFGRVDAVATDLPYGRASYTARERPEAVLRRFLDMLVECLKPGRMAALSYSRALHSLPEGLTLRFSHPIRVHRSLTRHFTVVQRVP